MNRTEFMSALEKRLMPLDAEDREDALRYYDELFDEAGPIDEQKILDDLGGPEVIARQILSDNGIDPDGRPEYMLDEAVRQGQNTQNNQNAYQQNAQGRPQGFTENIRNDVNNLSNPTKIVLIIAIIIVTAPIWGSVVGTLFGVLGGLIGISIGLVAAFSAAGVALTVAGIIYLFQIPPVGLLVLGIGMIVLALDILLIIPLVKWTFTTLIKLIKWAVDTIKGFINKRNGVAA